MNLLNTGLVTLWTPEIRSWVEPFAVKKEAYCERWKVTYYGYDDRIENERAPTWSKILALQINLAAHDWLLWIDADATITNSGADFRNLCDPDYDLIVTHDHGGFNAGVFLIQNTPRSKRFLERVWGKEIDDYHFEQTAMSQVMEEMPDLRVKVLPKRALNSYWFDHRPGDFIFHAAGEPNENKFKFLTIFANDETGTLERVPAGWPKCDPADTAGGKLLDVNLDRQVPDRSLKRAVITNCIVVDDRRYLDLVSLWARGVRGSGWEGDVIVYTNCRGAFDGSNAAAQYDVKIESIEDPASPFEAYQEKAVSGIIALDCYDEILFADVDVVVLEDPMNWAFSYDQMMVSQDVFNLFHPCMLGQWYEGRPDHGEPGVNTGIWSLARRHIDESLMVWNDEMSRRLASQSWPGHLHDQAQLNQLWFEGAARIATFPADRIGYPSTPGWVGNNPSAWAVHCCGVGSSKDEMRGVLDRQ